MRFLPEIDLILQSLRWVAQSHSPSAKSDINVSNLSRLDWRKVFAISEIHGILGFVAFAVERSGVFGSLPPDLRLALKDALIGAELSNRATFSEFKKSNRDFLEKNIPVIPLKGVDLSLRIYRGMPFRPMADIDLLIHQSDLAQVSKFIFHSGFRSKKSCLKNRWQHHFISKKDVSFAETRKGRMGFKKNRVEIDLHWNPRYRIGGHDIEIDIESLWVRTVPAPELGANIRILSPEDLAWHLTLHTAEMHHPRLIQLLDLALVTNRADIHAKTAWRQKVSGLANASREKIKALTDDVEKIFGIAAPASWTQGRSGTLIRFFLTREPSAPYRKEAVGDVDLSSELRSPVKRFLFFLCYFVPNPDYYTNRKGIRMVLTHWLDLAKNLVKRSVWKLKEWLH